MPHVSNIRFKGMKGDLLMAALPEIAVSSGSACTSVSPEPSHVLMAMGLSEAATRSSLRFSLGRFTGEADIDAAAEACRTEIGRAHVELPSLLRTSYAVFCSKTTTLICRDQHIPPLISSQYFILLIPHSPCL